MEIHSNQKNGSGDCFVSTPTPRIYDSYVRRHENAYIDDLKAPTEVAASGCTSILVLGNSGSRSPMPDPKNLSPAGKIHYM